MVLSMQPAHLLTDIELIERHWGGARGRGAYAFRSLLQRGRVWYSGATFRWPLWTRVSAFTQHSSARDSTAAPPRLASGREARASSRRCTRTPWRAAHAAGAAHRRGDLAPGYDADLVAWSVDRAVERDDGDAFRQGQAMLTIVAAR